ncbi:MAG TPA: hypothetical protein VHE81_04415, partial [Lacipirellulaceae bacterium]|nr:hypothetical protein [Lacipirellulaceae bacterium]
MRSWPPLVTWTAGFALAALAALVKGPQAPVYFVAITSVYLVWRRDWRFLFRWQAAAGAAAFVLIIALWQIPFYMKAGWDATVATWSGLAADRIHLRGVLSHVFTYPVETFVCLLPWSPILVALASRETRALLLPLPIGQGRGEAVLSQSNVPSPCPLPAGEGIGKATTFLFTAMLIAYPTVWLAAGARGRYFMPLYPLVAVLVGLVIERCSAASRGTYPRRAWHQFLLLWGTFIGMCGLLLAGATLFTADLSARLYQPRWFGLAFAAIAFGAVYLLWSAFRRPNRFAPLMGVSAIAIIAALGVAGFMMNINVARWNNPTTAVAELKNQLPPRTKLVSFSPIEHRFAYYFGDPIAELIWPRTMAELPPDINYFCFMRQPGDTAAARKSGRGRTEYTTPGTLPFAWKELMSICVERQTYGDQRTVVLGRVVRPLRATVSDVTKPQFRRADTVRQSIVR